MNENIQYQYFSKYSFHFVMECYVEIYFFMENMKTWICTQADFALQAQNFCSHSFPFH